MDVRSLRIERGWTQEELASRAGLSTRTVQRIERGGRANLASLQALTAAFGMAGQELLHYDLPVPPVSRRCALGLGTLLILPALLFVAVNVIRYSLGFSQVPDIFGPLFEIEWISVISPFIFVGGAGGCAASQCVRQPGSQAGRQSGCADTQDAGILPELRKSRLCRFGVGFARGAGGIRGSRKPGTFGDYFCPLRFVFRVDDRIHARH